MRKMRSRAIGVAVAALLVGAGSALAMTAVLRGNPKGVREADRVMRAFSHISGYSFSESHFFQIATKGGASPSLHYRFGYPSLQNGSSWASERGAMGLSNNNVVWWRDDLSPASNRAQPVEIVFNHNGGFWAFGGSANHGCFRKLQSGSMMPSSIGFVITGRVRAPQGHSGAISLTYSYAWQPAGTATETDKIDKSNLVTSGQVSLRDGYSFSFSNSFGGPGPAPNVNMCK